MENEIILYGSGILIAILSFILGFFFAKFHFQVKATYNLLGIIIDLLSKEIPPEKVIEKIEEFKSKYHYD